MSYWPVRLTWSRATHQHGRPPNQYFFTCSYGWVISCKICTRKYKINSSKSPPATLNAFEKNFSCLLKHISRKLSSLIQRATLKMMFPVGVQRVSGAMCFCLRACVLCAHALSVCNWNSVSFPTVSVLRLFRGLDLRGVQIPAARFLGEKGFLWYAPDQQWRRQRSSTIHWLKRRMPSQPLRQKYRLSKVNCICIKNSANVTISGVDWASESPGGHRMVDRIVRVAFTDRCGAQIST